MQGSSESQQLSALSVLLEHPGVASDHLLLCSAARVCTSWREAVAASGTGTTDTVIDNKLQNPQRQPAEYTDTLLSKLSGYAMWLPKHAATVHSISVSCSAGGSQTAFTTACQMLAITLRLASAGPRPLQLQRFASNITNSEVLAALPAGLTDLSLSGSAPTPSDPPFSVGSLAVALDRMNKLQSFSLSIPHGLFGSDIKFDCLAKHTHLTRLCLKLQGIDEMETWLSLQRALAGLPALQDLSLNLQFEEYLCDDDEPPSGQKLMGGPQLSSMIALTRLELSVQPILPGPSDWLAMPPQLQELTVDLTTELGWQLEQGEQEIQPVVAMNLTTLQHLRRVTLRCGTKQSLKRLTGTSDVLRTLRGAPRYEFLDIQYNSFHMVADDVAKLPLLPRLKGLSIMDTNAAAVVGNAAILKDLLQYRLPMLAELGGLTRLELCVFEQGSGSHGLQVCATLTQLTTLQRLRLDVVGQGKVRGRDCSHLKGMGTLTSLALRNMRGAVDDTVAGALACNLQELRYLDLTGCAIHSDTPMPAFACMRHLTKLVLTGNRGSSSDSVALFQRHRRAAGLPSVIVLK